MLILSILLFFTTCADNNSPTNSSDRSLEKASDISDINSTSSSDPELDSFDKCVLIWLGTLSPGPLYWSFSVSQVDSNSLYDFRDNYLQKSEKGEIYIASYYLLSEYGIKNNLVNKYPKEHLDLLRSSALIVNKLQNSSKSDEVLFKKEITDNIKSMLKVYRNSPNHRKIDKTLNYLEADLQKYYDKPGTEIAVAFEQTK